MEQAELVDRLIAVFNSCPEPPHVLVAIAAVQEVEQRLREHYEAVCAIRAQVN